MNYFIVTLNSSMYISDICIYQFMLIYKCQCSVRLQFDGNPSGCGALCLIQGVSVKFTNISKAYITIYMNVYIIQAKWLFIYYSASFIPNVSLFYTNICLCINRLYIVWNKSVSLLSLWGVCVSVVWFNLCCCV